MTAYNLLMTLHVLAAVLGTGCAAAIVIRARSGGDGAVADLRVLLLCVSVGLLVLLLSGLAALRVGGLTSIYLKTWWLRISILLFVGLGILVGYTRRLLRAPHASLVRVELAGWISCTVIAAIVFLMETQPS